MGSAVYRALRSEVRMKPVIFILGATGTGKSDLAIALAKRFGGEVVNADAMQLYQGLDIVTNKMSLEEQEGVRHHLLGILSPTSLSYTIHDYKKEASSIIGRLLSDGKMPIVVGGTNYYADSLMWQSLIPQHDQQAASRFVHAEGPVSQQTLSYMTDLLEVEQRSMTTSNTSVTPWDDISIVNVLDTNYMRLHINRVNSHKLHELLMRVDLATARTTHPNQSRKILRALEVLKHHGKTQSEFLSEINAMAGERSFGASLTYPNTIVIWLQSDKEVLDARLKKRVDHMIAKGLIKELASFHSAYNAAFLSSAPDKSHGAYTRGIFQCIGFKEFHSYLLLPESEQSSDAGQELFAKGVYAMQCATIRYAKYQNRWVRKQFFEERNSEVVPPVYVFDSTNVDMFATNVVSPAICMLEEILQDGVTSRQRHAMEVKDKKSNAVVYETCTACNVTCIRETEWRSHVNSRKHRKRLASLSKKKELVNKEYEKLSKSLTMHEVHIALKAGFTETSFDKEEDLS
ncbi:tRNA dimethylallyltransferase-like isoform X2 [Watersipora subatra]|uniref:tRNA dimethylallyltransferase-like isoform X2 n=1 Tax=Watersipora subatra TaxID=2589382 RepID=UPI00355C1BDF